MERTMDITTVGTVSEDEGTFVHFRDAAGELLYDIDGDTKTPVGAHVAGTYSKVYRTAQKKVKERNIRAIRRNEDWDAESFEERELALEVACLLSWTFTANGQPFPITVDNYKAVIAKQPQWQEQIQKAMNDHARFFAKTSPA
jgi:hypothetical protein